MTVSCPVPGSLVEKQIDELLTEFRESDRMLSMFRGDLSQVEEIIRVICSIPDYFDLDTAKGHQLTLVGERMGWSRCHCVCVTQPIIGFDCEGFTSDTVIADLCDENATWIDCGPGSIGMICLEDDEMYRSFLRVRRYQMMAFFDHDSLEASIQHLFGPTGTLLDSGNGRVVVAPGRDLTNAEKAVLQLYPRVLPVAPGIRIRFHFGRVPVIGFGEGWGGFCEPQAEGEPLTTETGEILETEDGEPIETGPLTLSADIMCEIDVHPYECP